MRHAPMIEVNPADFADADVQRLSDAVDEAKSSGRLDLEELPAPVREQVLFALEAVQRGHHVAAVTTGKPLTTTEAAQLLGMSRSHLSQLCKEGRVPSFTVGNSWRIESETVMTILRERGRLRVEANEAAASADDRRRARAARAAGLA